MQTHTHIGTTAHAYEIDVAFYSPFQRKCKACLRVVPSIQPHSWVYIGLTQIVKIDLVHSSSNFQNKGLYAQILCEAHISPRT